MSGTNSRCRAMSALVATALLLAAGGCAPKPHALAKQEILRLLGDDAKTVDVKVDGTEATLTGSVQYRSTRIISEQILLSQPAIASVDNQLTVPERQPMERMYMDSVDNGLRLTTEQFLLRRVGPELLRDLEIRAVEGIVSIRGPVASDTTRRKIVETTRSVEDVRVVIDLMRVGKPKPDGELGEGAPPATQAPRAK